MNDIEFKQSLEQVVFELANVPNGKSLGEALVANQDFIHWIQPEKITGVKEIRVTVGNAPQNLDDSPITTDFYEYLNLVIQSQIREGIITDGTKPGDYDDRKVRWSGSGVTGNWSQNQHIFNLEVGPTTYQRYRQDLERSKTESLKLMFRGLQVYQDPFAYFSRAIGVAVIPITDNGNVYIGERSPNVDCPGLLNFVAGLATFDEAIDKINFYADAQRELQEEVDIVLSLDDANTRFIGISGNPFTSEIDLVFVVETGVSEAHFQSNQWTEHVRLVPLRTKIEAEDLLYQGFLPGEKHPSKIAYSSRLGLEYLVKNHFTDP